MKIRAFVFIFFLLFTRFANGQTDTISGVINTYAPVISIDTCLNSVTVPSVAGFSVGDRVLIIQMKGATIDTSNTARYGHIQSMNGAGLFEIATIQAIPNLFTIQFRDKTLNTYDPDFGDVQLVRIPQYANVVVADTLRPAKWDPARGTGGVLILEASGTLTLKAQVNASFCGFQGGQASNNAVGDSVLDYTFDGSTGNGGYKGEGIATGYRLNVDAGRGAPANGGGGGNAENAGGGGGGNGGIGGRGGNQTDAQEFGDIPNGGEPGALLAPGMIPPRIFFGGGGGGGHENDQSGSNGGDGGGIIILHAHSIVATNDTIQANGGSPGEETGVGPTVARSDGAGGGGAGGTILIYADSNYSGNIWIGVKGGDGGSVDAENTPYRYGPGGGGAGGIYYTAPSSTAGGVAFWTIGSAGKAGLITHCSDGSQNGLSDGASVGATAVNRFITIPESSTPYRVPSASDHSVAVCSGDSIEISASNGDSYRWSPSNDLKDPTNKDQWVSPDSTTVYSVQITTGECVFTDTVHVEVLAKPSVTIVGPTTLCDGDTATLATSSQFDTYLWHPNGETTPTIKVWKSGTYSVDVTKGSGCSASSIGFSVTVDPAPAKPVISRNDSVLTSTLAMSYQWNLNGSPIPGDTLQTALAANDGAYTVTIADSNGCRITSDTLDVSGQGLATVSVPELSSGDPGTTVTIPLTLQTSNNLFESGAQSFAAVLRLDGSILTPLAPFRVKSGNDWLVAISGPCLGTSGVLGTISVQPVDSGTCSPVTIDTVYFPGAKIAVTRMNGQFCLTGACHPWLTSSDTAFYIKRIVPNPSSGEFRIDYHLSNEGPMKMELEDDLGRYSIVLKQARASTGDYSEIFSISFLPSGLYRCLVSSGSQTQSSVLEIIK